ncbi:hypothetical protein LPB140_05530 [Sphingorhabdus lutea]|uniref:PilZ domain-containing protein n=1 Tax=Sphingorhabdus lutea TaxID=1913578 RepID=A0A1L3JER6_9SPHN|nr:hypothetical protein LPB140_05530 [Sphingorhabdus lutea]
MPEKPNFGGASTIPAGQRVSGRDSMFLQAKLRFVNGGSEGIIRVRNISEGGMMAEAPIQAARGEMIEIELRNIGVVPGKIAWVAEGRVGISFDYQIDPKLTRHSVAENNSDIPDYLRRITQKSNGITRR